MSYMDPRPEGLNTEPAPKSVVETLKPRTWHEGPPPFPGWWNATDLAEEHREAPPLEFWRWWNGEHWSRVAFDDDRIADVVAAADAPHEHPLPVAWCDYWPENARVPRVNPNEVEA